MDSLAPAASATFVVLVWGYFLWRVYKRDIANGGEESWTQLAVLAVIPAIILAASYLGDLPWFKQPAIDAFFSTIVGEVLAACTLFGLNKAVYDTALNKAERTMMFATSSVMIGFAFAFTFFLT